MTAFTWPSNSTGSTMTCRGCALNRPEVIGTTSSGISVINMRRASRAHWPMSPSPSCSRSAWPSAAPSA